jgi:adenosylcobyric acid synthase
MPIYTAQQRVKGFILNQFRGDESLLKDANDWLLAKTGIPIVAVIPYLPHHLPEEDNFFHRGQAKHGQINIGLICYPYASNMDEFDPLAYCEGVSLIAVREADQLENLDALILPGSKHVAASREFLATSQLDQAIQQFAKRGKPVLGICGGLQLLGEDIHDAEQIEGGSFSGLGLLPLHTQFHKQKTTVQRTVHWQDSDLQIYEIHQGQSHTRTPLDTFVETGSGWQRHNISASYLHGLFENQVFLQHYLNQLGWQGKIQGNWQEHIEQELERVSDLLADRFGFL